MPERDRRYSIVGQDSRKDIKAKNQGQLENLRKKYLSILGNSEVVKKGNRGKHTLEAFHLFSQVEAEGLRTGDMSSGMK